MKKFFHSLILITAFAASLALPTGCKSTLETGGAYAPGRTTVENGVTNTVATFAPDRGFYIADASYDLAYSSIDAAFNFEKRNRAMLWQISPEIKRGLDKIRPEALRIARDYAVARSAYIANPTPSELSKLETILGRLQQLSNAAQSLLPKN